MTARTCPCSGPHANPDPAVRAMPPLLVYFAVCMLMITLLVGFQSGGPGRWAGTLAAAGAVALLALLLGLAVQVTQRPAPP